LADTTTTVAAPVAAVRAVLAVDSVETRFDNVLGVTVNGAAREIPAQAGATLDLGPLAEGDALGLYVRPDGTDARLPVALVPDGADAFRFAAEDLVPGGPNPRGFAYDGDGNDAVGRLVLEAGGTSDAEAPAAPASPLVEAVDWDALAAIVNANLAATGQWFAPPEGEWQTRMVDGTDWDALAAQVTANHAETGQWFA